MGGKVAPKRKKEEEGRRPWEKKRFSQGPHLATFSDSRNLPKKMAKKTSSPTGGGDRGKSEFPPHLKKKKGGRKERRRHPKGALFKNPNGTFLTEPGLLLCSFFFRRALWERAQGLAETGKKSVWNRGALKTNEGR